MSNKNTNEGLGTITRVYRADINGLRAIAVLLVLFFHLEFNFVKAGFLGVDIFLVISGYLITRNILDDLRGNQFSFKTFYTKRFRRLFPALFATLLLTLVIGFFTLTPANLERLSKTVLSGVFFISNIYFLSETGYFDTESAYKPLLHIWSLSLEEQFYFVWPLLLFLVFKLFRKGTFIFILVLIGISVYKAELRYNTSPERVFYLLQFRFFEFLLGALCIWLEKFKFKNKFAPELFLLTGLSLIGYSALKFTVLTPMPGLLSLIPCVGAMLVIYGGKDAIYSSWLLKNKIAELIGKSSYSVYLVHWPIIVYYKYYTLSELTNSSRVVLGGASLVMGFLMWKYIENTFRKPRLKTWRTDPIWIVMPSLMVLISYGAQRILVNKGYPSRYSAEFTMSEKEIFANRDKYWVRSGSDKDVLRGTDTKKVIVMGNSFAIDLIYALRYNNLTANIISFQTRFKCFNFGGGAVMETDTSFCNEIKKSSLADTNWSNAKAVYLFDHWPKTNLVNLKQFLQEIRTLTKAPIYVFGPKMVFSRPIPDIVHSCKSASTFAINKYAQDFAEKKDRTELNKMIINFFEDTYWRNNKIYFINVLDILGNGENTFDIISPKTRDFLYFDQNHFTDQGAKEFGEKLKESHPELFNLSH